MCWGSRQEVGKKRGRWNSTVWFGKRRVGGIQSGLGKLGGAWSALDCLHQIGMHSFLQISHMDPDKDDLKTLPKAQRTRGLSSSFQSNFLKLYEELLHKSRSNFIFRILTKNQPQNLYQESLTVPSPLIQHFRARP